MELSSTFAKYVINGLSSLNIHKSLDEKRVLDANMVMKLLLVILSNFRGV